MTTKTKPKAAKHAIGKKDEGAPKRPHSEAYDAALAQYVAAVDMVRRTNMFRYFYGQYGDLANEDNFERCLNTMLSYKRLVHLHPDPQRIRREFRQGEPTYGRLFALFHAHNAERVGKTRWGDKSLHTECFADNVFTAFPNARILHMVRDPRDRYASVLKRYATNRGMVGKATGKWLYSVVYGFHNVEKFPNKYMLVKYEELTLEPDKMVRKICDFLEVDFMPEMLSMSGAPDHNERGGNSSFQRFNPGEISTSPVGRYRKVLTQTDDGPSNPPRFHSRCSKQPANQL